MEFEQVDDGLVSREVLPPLLGATELTIPAGDAKDMRAREAALSEFRSAWAEIEPQVRRALFAYYVATCEAADESGPAIETEESVWANAALFTASVPELLPEGRYVQVVGWCSWDEERGLEICVRDGQAVLYVGPYVGNSHRNPRRGKPGNFAGT